MKATPNEGIRRSARMALASGLGAGLATGIRYGGRTCLQHLVLRLGLRYNGFAPWRYVDFLDYAAERIFLRKVGGGYIFIHRRLQDYFAIRQTEQDGTTPQKVLEQEPQATLSGDADERSWWAILTNHLWAMGMAVGLAGLLWVALAGQQDSEIAMTIPVEYQQIAPNHELRGEVPRKANVRLRGSQLALAATRLRPVRIRVSLAQVRAGIHYFLLTQNQIDLPAGVEITEIRPALLLLEVQIRQTDQDGTTPQKVLEQEPQATPSGDADERSWWAILTDNPLAKGEIAMTIPVEYQQVAPNIDLRGEVPDEVHVHLRGSQLALAATRLWPVRARVSLAQAREGLNYYLLDKNHIALPPGVEITEIRPASLLIEVQEKETFPHSKQ